VLGAFRLSIWRRKEDGDALDKRGTLDFLKKIAFGAPGPKSAFP